MNAITLRMSNNYAAALDAFLDAIEELGSANAAGRDAWHRAFIQTVEAAQGGTVEEDKAEAVVTRFAKGVSGAAQYDLTSPSAKTKTSEFRAAIKLGKLGKHIDGYGVIQRAADLYKEAHAGGMELRNTYQAFVQVARAQNKSTDYRLTDEEIMAQMIKPAADATVEKALKAAAKNLESAIKRNDESDAPIDMEETQRALVAIQRQLAFVK